QQGAHEQGVEQDAEGDGERQFHHQDQRDHGQRGEGGGEHDAGGGDDAAGDGQADAGTAAGAGVCGLLAYAGHQEDVVVHAERDQEHEGVQREGGVHAGVAEQVLEDQCGHADGGEEGQHDGGQQQQRGHEGAQQYGDDQEHHAEQQRDDEPVAAGGGVEVEFDRGVPADLRLGAGDAGQFAAQVLDGLGGGLGVRRHVEHDVHSGQVVGD